jgi:hypothetical protein
MSLGPGIWKDNQEERAYTRVGQRPRKIQARSREKSCVQRSGLMALLGLLSHAGDTSEMSSSLMGLYMCFSRPSPSIFTAPLSHLPKI